MKKEINLLVTSDLSKQEQDRIREISEQVNLVVIPTDNAAEVADGKWAETEVLYTWNVLPESEKAPNLKWVQFNSAGVDHFLDNPLVLNPEVTATTMSGVITGQIAEYVLMTMLAFGQRLPKLRQFQREKHWPQEADKWQSLLPMELRHSAVGIVGYGSIGRQVARLLQPFGAEVLAAKNDVMHPEDSGYIPKGMGDPHGDLFHRLYPIEALHSLLAESDFVVVALPLTPATRHILNAEAFAAMKETAYLVNVGRGELIDEPALVEALRTGQIAGAALDVFETEPLPEDSPLWEMENVIVSPHISGLSKHLREETLSLFIENINRYLVGLPLHNRIDLNKGY